MKIGLVGHPGSGKSTIFAALSGAKDADQRSVRAEVRVATTKVADDRIPFLKALFKPKKTVLAQIEYLFAPIVQGTSPGKTDGGSLAHIRVCDGLLHIVRNFRGPDQSPPTPEEDFWRLGEEMVLSDLVVAEKRLERIEQDRRKGKKPEGDEHELLKACQKVLEQGRPLRAEWSLASEPALKGFTFLSAKPLLVLINNEDEDESFPVWKALPEDIDMLVVRGRLEKDLVEMSPEDAQEFRDLYHLHESALERVVRESYRLLQRITFFTVISDEVRAWPIPAGTPALEAAGAVHSDMKKGFIRAEVLSFADLTKYGSFQEAKKAGQVRLEGKEYEVKDGDIINFRFSL